MQQTPVHDIHNADLLTLLPVTSSNIIEIGCSSGALAREFKKINENCHYVGVDIEQSYCDLAKRYCDDVISMNIDNAETPFFESYADRDCWIFGDTLEHLVDPWRVLNEIKKVIPKHGVIAASIPNAQHWSVFAKLSIGDFRYVDSGIFDRTHLRWFTYVTILELFAHTGFQVISIKSRIFDEPIRQQYMPVISLIGEMAKACGADPDVAIRNSYAFQYVILAVPV